MEHLRCVVERITYQNAENGYSVIKCRAKGYQELVTVVGSMPDVHVGSVLSLGGAWRIDSKYGRQFFMETFEETLPSTVYGIEKYLGSGLVKGIGPKFAHRIVQKFGSDTLDVIELRPERLLEVEGIGQIRVDRIKKSWEEQKEIKNIMLFLQGHDVSTHHATKIYKTYGNESINVVRENPYRLADDIWGIGFKTADTIARKLGFDSGKYVRIRSGILYTLNRLADEGHCYATRDMLLKTGSEMLSVDESVITMALDEMIRVQDVITDIIPHKEAQEPAAASAKTSAGASTASAPESAASASAKTSAGASAASAPESAASASAKTLARASSASAPESAASASAKTSARASSAAAAGYTSAASTAGIGRQQETAIYLPSFYYSEIGTARRLHQIYNGSTRLKVKTEGLADRIAKKTGMQYDQIQMEAILTAVKSKVLILTGGPGTGKTTTTLGIITAFREAGARIVLAAPTGRASKRLSEAAGLEAKTIHRLLEVKPPEGYQRNEANPLEGDVLIVDECSMIDIMLMYNLLKAVPDTMTLIMVGDVDQLPSVGAGNVLRDIIESGSFPVIRLTRIFRQAQSSRIIMNAHRINQGKMPDISNGRDSDFFFIDVEKKLAARGADTSESSIISKETADIIVEYVTSRLPRYYRTAPANIQVLTPMQRGTAGAANLNQALQEAVNPVGKGLRRGGYLYKERDKVMQIRNNYDKEVFNGDIGTVRSVNTEDRNLTVDFDGRLVEYDATELDELVLAYATTIHKSQGSEYPIVVMPVLMSHYIMLQRNLIYTGITRAKKILVMAGTKKALSYAVRNMTVEKRNTMLRERIQQAYTGSAYEK